MPIATDPHMVVPQDEWISEYKERRALWIHDGNPLRPHALLSSGKHSNGFFNSEIVMEDARFLAYACAELVFAHAREVLADNGLDIYSIDRVVGPAMGAITIAHEIAKSIAERRGNKCLRAYTEKEGDGEGKLMTFKKTAIFEGERVLAVEDVLTTGGSVDATANAIIKAGGIVLPLVVVLVNRSGLKEVSGKRIVALIDHPMPMWAPEECPLCKEGSEAIRPKGAENWKRLNASY